MERSMGVAVEEGVEEEAVVLGEGEEVVLTVAVLHLRCRRERLRNRGSGRPNQVPLQRPPPPTAPER